MSKLTGVNLSRAPARLTVLAFRGPDAARFLQGQLSADIEKLDPGGATLAGLHNPQGRVIAVLGIARTAADELFAVLPAGLASAVAQRLRKYVLRSKLEIAEIGDSLSVVGATTLSPGFPAIRWGTRHLLLVPQPEAALALNDEVALAQWLRADITEGLPQIYAATSESFVAQMLNLDLLGAISFEKGCYTGQEVVARAHYRGRVKRRLQRWHNASGTQLEPGDAARAPDGRPLTVISVAPGANEGQELLAVGPFATGIGEAAQEVPADSAGVLVSGPLPLPYSLPV
jgi:tRNA-modifying protein YgfZ